MSHPEYRPRISVEIRDDQYQIIQKMLPHGTQKLLFQALLDGVIALYNKGGFNAIGAIISGHVDVTQLARQGLPYTHSSTPKD